MILLFGNFRFQNPQKPKKIQLDSVAFKKGEILFVKKCESCHIKDMVTSENFGRPLGGITKKRSRKWLAAFIRNSMAMVYTKKDSLAIDAYRRGNGAFMTSFPELSDTDLENIYLFIETVYNKPNVKIRPIQYPK